MNFIFTINTLDTHRGRLNFLKCDKRTNLKIVETLLLFGPIKMLQFSSLKRFSSIELYLNIVLHGHGRGQK